MTALATGHANHPEPVEVLEQVVLLLDHVGRELLRVADQEATGSPAHWLGLGVVLAQARAVELLPEGHGPNFDRVAGRLPGALGRDLHDAAELSPLQLLRAAEKLTRSEVLCATALPGLSLLVVELCDLIREMDTGGH